jgi:hypothetical protein
MSDIPEYPVVQHLPSPKQVGLTEFCYINVVEIIFLRTLRKLYLYILYNCTNVSKGLTKILKVKIK